MVENLFQSVQLNIHNPHFLIMQGQITKVLAMKPPEILAMLEETAGTRMFEEHRLKALQTMEKKGRKLEEIEVLLGEVVEPKLQQLKNEKAAFLQLKALETDLDRAKRVLSILDYKRRQRRILEAEQKLSSLQQESSELVEAERQARLQIEQLTDTLATLRRRRRQSPQTASQQALALECQELSATLVRLQTQLQLQQETIQEAQRKLKEAQGHLKGLDQEVEKKREAHQKAETEHSQLLAEQATLTHSLRELDELVRSLSTGIAADGQETGYAHLVSQAKDRLVTARTRHQQAISRQQSLQAELKSVAPQAKRAQQEASQLISQLEQQRQTVTNLQAKLASMTWDPARHRELVQQRTQLERTLEAQQEQLEALKQACSSLLFTHAPIPGLPSGAVRGTVASQVRTEEVEWAQALEVAAGARLYNVRHFH